ncbi:MAG: DNA-binding protein [Pedobacter sp.]|nr:MAG: DNA-binding protein [Pedobacter sp.]
MEKKNLHHAILRIIKLQEETLAVLSVQRMEKETLHHAMLRVIKLQEETLTVLRVLCEGEQIPIQKGGKLLTRQEVLDYLRISERTYVRKVNSGELKPMKMLGGDRFYLDDLIAAYKESKRRGRI